MIILFATLVGACTNPVVAPDDAPQPPANAFAGSYTTTVNDTVLRMYIGTTGAVQWVLPDYQFNMIMAGHLVAHPPVATIYTTGNDTLQFIDWHRDADTLRTMRDDSTRVDWFKYL